MPQARWVSGAVLRAGWGCWRGLHFSLPGELKAGYPGGNTGPAGQEFREPGGGERRACAVSSWPVCERHLVGTPGTAARDPLS